MIGDWTPRGGLSGPLRKGRAWFSDSITAQYVKHVVEELPQGLDRVADWRLSNLLHTQVNLTPSNILFGGFLLNYWNAPRQGRDALARMETRVALAETLKRYPAMELDGQAACDALQPAEIRRVAGNDQEHARKASVHTLRPSAGPMPADHSRAVSLPGQPHP